ncbi:MAG: hypothetical protein QE263_06085 [Vampirovibrionales bacterium]|nr:hypothetical protein [Vampirovibrionales bacterium]
MNNDFAMGWTAGIGVAANNEYRLALEEARTAPRIGQGPQSQVEPTSEWGKGKAIVPEKPNVLGSIISALLPMGLEYLKAQGDKKTEAEKAKQKKIDDAQKRIDDAAALAAKNAHEIELEKIKAGKPTPPPEDKPETTPDKKEDTPPAKK